MMYRGQEVVPSGPFADWLNQRHAYYVSLGRDPIRALCWEIGWADGDSAARRLYRYRYQLTESSAGKSKARGLKGVRKVFHAEVFIRALVEEALFHAGVAFADLYPEIAAAEELVLEPASWCPGCREERSPINGVCPFCEWRIGPETGQELRGRMLKHWERKVAA